MSAPHRPKLDQSFWIDVLSGQKRGIPYIALRGLLYGASALYSVGLGLYLGLERIGVRKRLRLPVPVVSIGNLSSGGTGKTPMTQYVVDVLQDHGLKAVILSRGHGGSLSHSVAQVSDENGAVLRGANEVGDEAVALAHRLSGTPVFVGKDRRRSAAAAMVKYSPDLFVLDDGFQYWQLARDLDIVLLDSRKPFDNGYPLPRGLLREPKQNLRRTRMVVITRADLATREQLDQAMQQAQKYAPKASLFLARHVFNGLRPLNELAERQLPEHGLAVCAIAQPDAFASLLISAGIGLTSNMVALADHAVYDEETVRHIKGRIVSERADSVITTDKDAVKLPAQEFDCPVFSATLKIEIDRPDEFYEELIHWARLRKSTK